MELKTKLEQLHARFEQVKDMVNTEEATKNAFVMPFLQILGYDVFNPADVLPEYIADIGTKKGEKVDYLVMQNGEPAIIIECKHWKCSTDAHNSQLYRYYANIKARFGIMTNGIEYSIFTDLERSNIMDEKPFLTINLADLKDSAVKELEKFTKTGFNIDTILDSAESLKYVKSIRSEFEKELVEPSNEFVKMLVSKFYDRPITANRLELFKGFTKRAISSFVSDTVNSRLKSALSINEKNIQEEESENETEPISDVVTTEEEIEGFQIIKAILREKIPSERIAYRDTQSYFGILLDDNNRKPLCRLRFNTANKYIELFDKGKDNSEKMQIESLDDIYKYKKELLNTVDNYEL